MIMTTAEKTADQYRQMAKDARQRSQESWERSDTDGFLSQWASDSVAREYDMLATLAEQGGMITTRALFNLDGTVASTHLADGQWGAYWVLNDAATAKYGKRFFTPSNASTEQKRAASNARRGFTFGTIRVRGSVEYVGKTITAVRPVYRPVVEDLRDGKYEIVSTTGEDF